MISTSAPVAQLDRAFACGAKGRRFESCRVYHNEIIWKKTLPYRRSLFLYCGFIPWSWLIFWLRKKVFNSGGRWFYVVELKVEAWPSGWRRTTRNRVGSNVSEVRILSLPPERKNDPKGLFFCFFDSPCEGYFLWEFKRFYFRDVLILFTTLASEDGGKSF